MSDLDLCLMGSTIVQPATMERLSQACSESSLPYKVDIVEWANISAAFRAVIENESFLVRRGT